MNKIIAYTIFALLMTSAGCNKYLAKEPDNRAKLTDPQKVAQLLGTAYPQANYMAFNEALSDNATDKGAGDIDNTNLDPYFFNDVNNNAQDSPDGYWDACYAAIAAANEALKTCNEAPDPNNYRAQKGEALLCRAYAHFALVTLYSKTYDPSSASTDVGIPYVTEPETVVIKHYDRGTVASVYANIEKDITDGLPLLDDASYKVLRYHFNKAAANAFAARFYLYKRDYTKTVQYANAAVPDFLPNLRPWNTTYQTLQGNELPLEYQRTTQPANLLLVSCPSNYCYNFNYATYRYGMDNSVLIEVLQDPVQVTGGSWSFSTGTIGSQSNLAVPKLHMRDFASDNPTSNFGVPYGTVCLFTVEEVLFNKAEANVYLNNTSAAINDLNLYMSTRLTGVTPGNLPLNRKITNNKVLAYYNNTLSLQEALLNLILEYKRAEYVQEGMRWFDMLRYNIPVTHKIVGPGGVVTGTISLSGTDKRRQLKLPDAVKLSGITDLNR